MAVWEGGVDPTEAINSPPTTKHPDLWPGAPLWVWPASPRLVPRRLNRPPPPILSRSCCQIWPKLPPPCPLGDGSLCSQPSLRAASRALGPSAPRPSLPPPLPPATFRDVFPPEIPGPRPLPGGAEAAPRGREGRPGPPALPATSAHRRPVAHPARPVWRPAPLPVLSARGSAAAAAAASAREGPARPPHRPLREPQKRGTPRPPPPRTGFALGGSCPAGGSGVGTTRDFGAGVEMGGGGRSSPPGRGSA